MAKPVNKEKICSICGTTYYGYGHSAQPLNDGRCCMACNDAHVIPRRLADIMKNYKPKEQP
jgi:hypothetical protein